MSQTFNADLDKSLAERDLDIRLEESLTTTWDAQVVDYDVDEFPFDAWVLGRLKLRGYDVKDLQHLHETIPSEEAYKVSKLLCEDTNLPEFRRMVNRFIKEVIVVKGKLELPVAVQRFFNVRIMLPNKPLAIFPFHTGLLYGHGPASRSLWLPLTDVSADEDKTASMQIIGIKRSRELSQYAKENELDIGEMSELFAKESHQCKAGPGKIVFFGQENIHGNFVNMTGKTRISIDFRIAEAQYGDRLARKIPGGYFALIPDDDAEPIVNQDKQAAFDNGKSNVIYLNNATAGTDGAPVHLQRYMVYEYCQKFGLNYEFELFELEALYYLPTLLYVVHELKCNAILYSIFALPEDEAFRERILDTALENGLVLHFVNEDMSITNKRDREIVERTLDFAKYGHDARTPSNQSRNETQVTSI